MRRTAELLKLSAADRLRRAGCFHAQRGAGLTISIFLLARADEVIELRDMFVVGTKAKWRRTLEMPGYQGKTGSALPAGAFLKSRLAWRARS
jgi:hypothetical protein